MFQDPFDSDWAELALRTSSAQAGFKAAGTIKQAFQLNISVSKICTDKEMAVQKTMLTTIVFASSGSAAPASRKRGLGFGGSFSCQDADLLTDSMPTNIRVSRNFC